MNDDSLINANGLGTPTSMPFKKSAKKEKGRKTLGEKKDEKENPYGKDLNPIKSQSLFSNYYSGTSFFYNSFCISLKQRQENHEQFKRRTLFD